MTHQPHDTHFQSPSSVKCQPNSESKILSLFKNINAYWTSILFRNKSKKNKTKAHRQAYRQTNMSENMLPIFYHNTSSMCNVYRFKHVQLQYNYSLDVKLYVFDFSVKYVCSSQWSFNSIDISMVSFLCYSLESTLWKPWFRYMSRRFCQTYGS